MKAAASELPPGPKIADWMEQLKDRQPVSIRVGNVILHRVDALVFVTTLQRLDSLSAHVLNLLSVEPHPLSTERLGVILGLPPEVTRRILSALLDDGLIIVGEDSLSSKKTWSIPSAVRPIPGTGYRAHRSCERRVLTFLECADAARPAQYVNVCGPEWGEPVIDNLGGLNFKRADIGVCIRQSLEWKQRRGFPLDIAALCESSPRIPPWQSVIINKPERCRVLLLQDTEGFHGFALDRRDWSLHSVRPYFTLADLDAVECFPGTDSVPSEVDWRRAWQDWMKSHGLFGSESSAVRLQLNGTRLRVQVPETMRNRLVELLNKNGGWLAVASAAFHTLARVEIDNALPS
jgi:hypothetical protein